MPVDLKQVLTSIRQQDHLPADWIDNTRSSLQALEPPTPWYVRTLIGFSAWLAMLFLLMFMFGIHLIRSEQGMLISGGILLLSALLLRKNAGHEFQVQSALALSLAGQTLLYAGISILTDSIITSAVVAIVLSLLLLWFYNDRLHRFLSTVIAVFALGIITNRIGPGTSINLLVVALAFACVYLFLNEEKYLAHKWSDLYIPVSYGVVTSLLLILLPASIIFLLPKKIPYLPYIVTIGLALALLYLCQKLLQTYQHNLSRGIGLLLLIGIIVFALATAQAPGILASMIVITIGFANGNRILTGIGFVFMTWYFSTYYYSLDLSLLAKSITLMAGGITCLVLRFFIRRSFALQEQGHA